MAKYKDLTITDSEASNAVITECREGVSVTLMGVSADELVESDFDFLG